ncbi:MAG: Y-family DNA polymerase [Myxococcaceae bacterium]
MRLVYVHLPRFPVQHRVREAPSLMGKPFVLYEEVKGQRRVAFGSTAVLRTGVRVGMTVSAAQALCPSLGYFLFQPPAEEAALSSLGEALMAVTPAFQLSSPDGLWLDASAASLCGGEEGLRRRVLALTLEHGYRAQAVVAEGLFTSRALGRHGVSEVVQESARALTLLPIQALGVEETLPSLVGLGLTTLGALAKLPVGAVVARLGAGGLRAHRLCLGEDDTRFVPRALTETVEESIDLDWPAESLEPLLFAMKTTLDRICARLSGRRRAAVRLTFTLKLDPSGEAPVTLALSRPSAQAKLILDLATHRLADLTLRAPVAALWVRVDETSEDRGQQLLLGDGPQGDAALEVVLSRLHTALGEDALFAAKLESTHRPEGAYARNAFRPPDIERGMWAEAKRQATGLRRVEQADAANLNWERPDPRPIASSLFEPEGEIWKKPRRTRPPPSTEPDLSGLARPARYFRAPATLETELGTQGELLAARLLGKRRKATAVAGPERLTGDWWSEDPFARDYYRVHFEGLGPAWIYRDSRDGRFYLHGLFD